MVLIDFIEHPGNNSEVLRKIYEQIHFLLLLVVLVLNHEDDVFRLFRRWMALLGDDSLYGPVEPLAGVVRVPPTVKDATASVEVCVWIQSIRGQVRIKRLRFLIRE